MARRGENIRKRSDGRWEGRYIKGRADGKAIWGYLYGYSYSEVKTELTRRKAMSGFYQLSGASMRFSELAELWLASFAQGVKESTLTHYQYTLHKYLLPVLGDLPVSELNESTLERLFLQILSPSDNSHKPLGTSSAQECFGMLKRICKYAARLHLMPPLELCVKLPRQKKAEPRPLSLAEQAALGHSFWTRPHPEKSGCSCKWNLACVSGKYAG